MKLLLGDVLRDSCSVPVFCFGLAFLTPESV
jgi:hypothetical protein